MAKLPVLQKFLNYGAKREEIVEIIDNCRFSGMNYVLMVKERDKNDEDLKNKVIKTFHSRMESDYTIDEIINVFLNEQIIVSKNFLLEGILFMVFEREL